MGRYPSGQRGQTVNLLAYAYAGSNPALPTILIMKGLPVVTPDTVDTPPGVMHDKVMTNSGNTPRKRGQPFLRVKHGSAVVPIYKGRTRKWDYFTVAFHMNGKRVRRNYGTLEKAKAEAQIVAKRIQEGFSATDDLTPVQRECDLAAEKMVAPFNMPPVSALDEYARCRHMLRDVPLMAVVQDFLHRTRGVTLGAKVPDLVGEFLKAKGEDKMSERYLDQLGVNARRFATAFPMEIMSIKSGEIDRWLRGLGGSPVTRNSVNRCIKVLFSFAKSRGYLPASESAAAELVPLAKEAQANTEIFQPVEIQKLLTAASADILPLLAIGGFAGLRVAEICRLDWSAVDLERRIITLRADQAKTASRRIVPISDNLAAWLGHLSRIGKVIPNEKTPVDATALAKKLGVKWPHNGLRHSSISYRIAEIKDAAKVAMEAGNSPKIIFKHYLELVTEQHAQEWFSISPPDGWTPPASDKVKYAPRPSRRRHLINSILG